jgi:hypothetical protein
MISGLPDNFQAKNDVLLTKSEQLVRFSLISNNIFIYIYIFFLVELRNVSDKISKTGKIKWVVLPLAL